MRSILCCFIAMLTLAGTCKQQTRETAATNDVLASTGDAICDSAIALFNKNAVFRIASEVKRVKAMYGDIPADLRSSYREASLAWNKGLEEIRSEYSHEWKGVSFVPVRTTNTGKPSADALRENQRFFYQLTTYLYGEFPVQSTDEQFRQNWILSADLKRRLDAYWRSLVDVACATANPELVRARIQPQQLPADIDALLRL